MVDKKTLRAQEQARLAAEQAARDEDALNPTNIAVDDLLGGRQWKRSKIGYVTGISAFTDAGRSVIAGGKEGFGRVKTLMAATFARDTQGRAIPVDDSPADERFRAAMAANGKTMANVKKSIDNTYTQFWVYAAILVGMVVLGIGSIALYGWSIPQFPLFDIVFRLVPLPIAGAMLLRAGYTNWMFRRRRLDSLNDYLRSGDLLPRKAPNPTNGGTGVTKSGSGKNLVRAIMLVIATSFVVGFATQPTPVYAQQSQTDVANQVFNEPDRDDIFVRLLAYLIPNVGPIGETEIGEAPQHAATKVAFMMFSGTLMFIAAAVSGWQILSGLVASAKEGTVLGKLYHEVWAPLRVVFGFGMLAPIAGGLCAAQIICLYLVVWGSNLANIVWTPYINTVTFADSADAQQNAKDTVGAANLAIANEAVRNVFEKELCWNSIHSYITRTNDAGAETLINMSPTWMSITPSPVGQFFGDNNKYHELDYGPACGKISIQVPNDAGQGGNNEQRAAEHAAHLMAMAQSTAIQQIQAELRPIASKAAQTYQITASDNVRYFEPTNDTSEARQALREAKQTYTQKVVQAAGDTFSSSSFLGGATGDLEQFREEAITNGWASAGVFYMSIARVQNAVYSAAANSARFDNYDPVAPGNLSEYLRQAMFGTAEEPGAIVHFANWWDQNIDYIAPDISADAVRVANQAGAWGDILNPIFGNLVGLWKVDENYNILNPMQHMIEMGNRLMLFGTTAYVASAAVSGGAEGAAAQDITNNVPIWSQIKQGAGHAAKAVFQSIASFATIGALALIAAGAVHAFILPMIPYVMSVFFISGLVLLTAEALVAAPIWAFFHIRMDGQEFVSDVQKPGYMIAFNLILRPALMIFGLILSYLVFGGMAWFVEQTFYPTAMGLTSSMGIGPIGPLVMVIMVTYIHFQLAVRAFSMILQVPDRVTRWFGQGGERLGEEDDTNRSTGFIVSQTSNRIEGAAKMGGIGGGGRMRGLPKGTGDKGADPQLPGGNAGGGGKPAGPSGSIPKG